LTNNLLLTENDIQKCKLEHKEVVQKYNSTLSEEQKTLVKIQVSQTNLINELLFTEEDIQSRKNKNKEAVKKYLLSKKSQRNKEDIPADNTNEDNILTNISDNLDMDITDNNFHVDNAQRREYTLTEIEKSKETVMLNHRNKWTLYREQEKIENREEMEEEDILKLNTRRKERESKLITIIDEYFTNHIDSKPSDEMLRHFEKDARIALLLFYQQTGYDSVPGSENIELSIQDIDTIKDALLKSVLTPMEAEQRLLEYQARMPHNKLKCICACCQEERYSEKLYIHYDVSKLQLLKVPQAQLSKYKKILMDLQRTKDWNI